MTTIIDHNEHLQSLNVGLLQNITIEKDKGTPKREDEVHVTAATISLGLGSSVLIQDHGILTLTGLIVANVLGTIDIGNNGMLALNAAIGANLLSNINFVATDATARLIINTAAVNITGNVNGFGAHDVIQLNSLAASSAVWSPGLLGYGTLELYNAAGTQIGGLGMVGNYTSADFAIKEIKGPHGVEATRISFIPPDISSAAGGASAVHDPAALSPITAAGTATIGDHFAPLPAHLAALSAHYG
jgi:hypothetical protein